jgi:hypothetical protein
VLEEGPVHVDSEGKGGRHRVKGAVWTEVEVKGFVRVVSILNEIVGRLRFVLLYRLRWVGGRMSWWRWGCGKRSHCCQTGSHDRRLRLSRSNLKVCFPFLYARRMLETQMAVD